MRTVVLDIDQTIADYFPDMNTCQIKERFPHCVDEFQKRGLFLRIMGTWHIIFPGVVEFIRWLDQQGVHIVFFSAATSERNELLVMEILKRAFDESTYAVKARAIRVFSRHHLTEERYKNLGQVVPNGGIIEDVVMIDDQPKRIGLAHQHQLIVTQSTFIQHFAELQLNTEPKSAKLKSAKFHANQLCYMTAMIDASIEHADANKCSLSAGLRVAFKAADKDKSPIDAVLKQGELILKQVNPNFALAKPRQLFAADYCPPIPKDYHERMIFEMLNDEVLSRLTHVAQERTKTIKIEEVYYRFSFTQKYFPDCKVQGLPFGIEELRESSSSFDCVSSEDDCDMPGLDERPGA